MSLVLPAVTTKYAEKTEQVILDQNPPVLNTLHEVFSATGGVKLLTIRVRQDNTPTNVEEIDIVITKDGTAYTYDASAIGGLNNATEYTVHINSMTVTIAAFQPDIMAANNKVMSIDSTAPGLGTAIKGHDIMVQVRQTSAIAAGARIRCKCTYEVLEAV